MSAIGSRAAEEWGHASDYMHKDERKSGDELDFESVCSYYVLVEEKGGLQGLHVKQGTNGKRRE